MSQLGGNGYLADINQINSNLANFRGLQAQARQAQKDINIQAKQENDLDDLRKVGTGISEKAFKDAISKYGSKLYYNRFGGGQSLKDLDYRLGDKLLGRLPADKALPQGQVRDSGVELGDMGKAPRPMTTPEEAERPMIEKLGEGAEDAEHNPADAVDKEGGMGEHDPEDVEKALDDDITPQEFTDHLDSKYNFGGEGEGEGVDELAGGGADIAESAGSAGADLAGDVATGTALEATGTALDATGVLAPVGAIFNLIGAGLDIFGAVEAGKGIVDAFENDVLGHQTYKTPQIQQPQAPNTLLSKNLLITPTSDTLHQQGSSFATGW